MKTIGDKWFVNLSSVQIPENVISFLQLGSIFSLAPSIPKKTDIFEIIQYIENNIKHLSDEGKNDIRSHLFPHLDKYINSGRKPTKIESDILKLSLTIKKFKNNPNLFTRSDKGNTIVSSDRATYVNKVFENLEDFHLCHHTEESDQKNRIKLSFFTEDLEIKELHFFPKL